jgi:hypothetical protein
MDGWMDGCMDVCMPESSERLEKVGMCGHLKQQWRLIVPSYYSSGISHEQVRARPADKRDIDMLVPENVYCNTC